MRHHHGRRWDGLGRRLAVVIFFVFVAGGTSSVADAATIVVTASNQTKCQTKTGGNSAFGSLVPYTSCQGSAAFGNGVMYNDAVATIGGSGALATLEIDGGLLTDAADGHGKKIHLRQDLRFNITLDIQAAPDEEWELHVSQAVSGLYAIIAEGTTPSTSGFLGSVFDFFMDGQAYDVAVSPTTLGGTSTASVAFSGARSDVLTGTGPALLTGVVGGTLLQTLSQCVGSGCGSGDEVAFLFGLDDIGGALSLPVTADDYATWGRELAPDGYTASFQLFTVPEPSTSVLGLLALAGFVGAARFQARRQRPIQPSASVR